MGRTTGPQVLSMGKAFRIIANDIISHLNRSHIVLRGASIYALTGIPGTVRAANTIQFEPVATLTPEQAESVNQEGGSFDINFWTERGNLIRGGSSVYQCLANLTAALEQVGQLNNAEYGGAAGALSLLPTAGALLGAPSKEMWIVYKLVPLAGILSMFLSLGATIAPDNATDFDPEKKTLYGGLMPTVSDNSQLRTHEVAKGVSPASGSRRVAEVVQPAHLFAERVRRRAEDSDTGGEFGMKIWLGIALQFALIIIILVPMWFAQQGSVVTWWCRAWGWMWFWYFLVTIVSISESLLAAPFSKSWTIRVSRAPTGITVDRSQTITDRTRQPNALEYIKKGINTQHRIVIDPGLPSVFSRTCFYVVISVEGITRSHAVMKMVSKGCGVAVYAFGTALFASATMMSISVALMVLSLLLASGVMGRIIVMWIASEMNKNAKPILHAVVADSNQANEYFHAIAELPLQIEIQGNIILNGVPVCTQTRLFSAETYIGLLAKPFNLVKEAEKSSRQTHSGPLLGSPLGLPLADLQHYSSFRQHSDSPAASDRPASA